MRRWLLACLALVAGAAFALWPRAADTRAVVPVATPDSATAHATVDGSAPVLVGVESEPAQSRMAAGSAFEVVAHDEFLVPTATASSTRLALLVLEPDGRPWERGRLQLVVRGVDADVGELGAFDLSPRTRGRLRENSANLGAVRALEQASDWVTDGEGRAELTGIEPGRAFEVFALDGTGREGGSHAGAPLAAGEARAAELRLTSRARPVLGRCVDEHGDPLERVRIAGFGFEQVTDAGGRFATPALFGDEVALTFARRGVVGHSETVPLPIRAPLEIVLERARSLTVTLLDERGEAFTLRGLQARNPASVQPIDTYPEVRDGVHVFESMPRVPVTLEIVGSGSSPTLEVDAHVEQVRWSLPQPGKLEVLRGRLPPDFPTSLTIELRQPGSEEIVFEHDLWLGQLQRPQHWSIFPGRYTLQLHVRTGSNPTVSSPSGAPRAIEVRAGETVVVSLGD